MKKTIKRTEAIAILEKMNDKDFSSLVETIEKCIEEKEKALKNLRAFDTENGTIRAYREAENRFKISKSVETTKLKAFFELLTGKNKTFMGRVIIRTEKKNPFASEDLTEDQGE